MCICLSTEYTYIYLFTVIIC